MRIGSYQLENNLILAPMAGISDRPFRELCKQFGAGLAVSEMVASNPALRKHKRTLLHNVIEGEVNISPFLCGFLLVMGSRCDFWKLNNSRWSFQNTAINNH